MTRLDLLHLNLDFYTSTIRDIPSEVFLSCDDGMPQPCAINCDHLQTVAKSRIGSLITMLSREKLALVRKAVGFALEF
jgi:mRNA interferase MazF